MNKFHTKLFRNNNLRFNGYGSGLHTHVSFVVIFFGTIALTFLLIKIYSFLPQPPSPPIGFDLLTESAKRLVWPEPVEKFVFMNLAVLIPLLGFISILILSKFSRISAFLKQINSKGTTLIIVPLIIAGLFFTPFFGSVFLSTILGKYSEPHQPVYITLIVCYAISLLWCFWKVVNFNFKSKNFLSKNFYSVVIWLIFISSVLMQMLPWRLVGINGVTENLWTYHLDPVIFSLSQVVGGKTLLVDLPSQYGLFPEFLAPFFHIIRLSILNLLSVFAVLQFISLISLFYVLFRLVRTPLLCAMGGIALVMVTFGTESLFSGWFEPYFQYWPIRIFWPALSVLVFYNFSQKKTIFRSALMSFLGAIGFLWNLDSGVFIVIAYAAFLVAKLFVLIIHQHQFSLEKNNSWRIKEYLLAISFHIGITIFVIMAFLGLLNLKSGELLNFFWIFEYQKIFYNVGFMMLPMPLVFDPWMSILGVYLIGLLVSFNSWFSNSAGRQMDTVFYLSMLGIGLFTYYQGRSHVMNLVSVCWPALMIVIILTDEYIRAIRANILPKTQIILPAVGMALILVCCYSFISGGPTMFSNAKYKFLTRGRAYSPLIMNELAFIKQYAANKHKCLILSARQGIYYAEAGLVSPFRGPSLVEMILQSDYNQFINQIRNDVVPCIFLGIGRSGINSFNLGPQIFNEKYSIIAINDQHSMLYLEPILERIH